MLTQTRRNPGRSQQGQLSKRAASTRCGTAFLWSARGGIPQGWRHRFGSNKAKASAQIQPQSNLPTGRQAQSGVCATALHICAPARFPGRLRQTCSIDACGASVGLVVPGSNLQHASGKNSRKHPTNSKDRRTMPLAAHRAIPMLDLPVTPLSVRSQKPAAP